MAAVSQARCPTCKEPVPAAPEERTAEFPFCSERCRLLDLHRWFAGDYRVPVKEAPAGAAEEEGEA